MRGRVTSGPEWEGREGGRGIFCSENASGLGWVGGAGLPVAQEQESRSVFQARQGKDRRGRLQRWKSASQEADADETDERKRADRTHTHHGRKQTATSREARSSSRKGPAKENEPNSVRLCVLGNTECFPRTWRKRKCADKGGVRVGFLALGFPFSSPFCRAAVVGNRRRDGRSPGARRIESS